MKDALGGAFANCLAFGPRLDVSATEFGAGKPNDSQQNSATASASTSARLRGVWLVSVMSSSAQCRSACASSWKRVLKGRAARGLMAILRPRRGVTLGVAVQVIKRNALDLQGCKRFLLIPFGNSWRLVLLAFCLRKHKPVVFVNKVRELLMLLGAVIFLDRSGPLAGNGHTNRQCLLALLHLPAKFFPIQKGGQRTQREASFDALIQS